MKNTNVDIINNFFNYYSNGDIEGLKKVVWHNVRWFFPGQNPLSGTKQGVEEVIEFFDKMGSIMGISNVSVENTFTRAICCW